MKARRKPVRILDRLLLGIAGLLLSVGFVAAPTLLAHWIMLFN